jgi:hypothetical protein
MARSSPARKRKERFGELAVVAPAGCGGTDGGGSTLGEEGVPGTGAIGWPPPLIHGARMLERRNGAGLLKGQVVWQT